MSKIIDQHKKGPCMKKDCKNISEFNVFLMLRPHGASPVAKSTPVIQVCAAHNNLEWKDVVTDEAWEEICLSFERLGWRRPVIKYSFLSIEPI